MGQMTAIISVTDKCNMACKYCYAGCSWRTAPNYEEINQKFYENIPLLTNFIKQLISYNNNKKTRISFHGGEPCLINTGNYEVLLDYLGKNNLPTEVTFQTNGTLISDKFISMFKKYNVKVGLSLDGPVELNDQTRVFIDGKGAFSKIYANIQKLKSNSINFGCLVTLNKKNIDDIEKIYYFFKENRIPFDIRPIFYSGYPEYEEYLITPEQYSIAFCKLFDLWFKDDCENNLLEEYESIIARYIKPKDVSTSCVYIEKCSEHIFCIDMDGNVLPCSRFNFDCTPELSYGNIKNDSLEKLLCSSKAKKFSKRWMNLKNDECKDCIASEYCYGGCPANAYFHDRSYYKKDYFCKSYKKILTYVYEQMHNSTKN